MGFFDTIEQLTVPANVSEQEATAPPASRISGNLNTSIHLEQPGDAGNDDLWRPSEQDLAERKRLMNQKPERLSFLQPCPICNGRAFVHIFNGGFVCRTCQPGFFGKPVEATGPDRPAPDHELIMANDSVPTGGQSARIDHITERERNYFKAAWPWIKENKQRLLAAGWTRATLLQRSKFKWPYGPWGLAWLPVWNKEGVSVTIGRKGAIIFTYQSCGRTITQETQLPNMQK